MGLAMHDIHHIISDLDAHPDTLLMWEVHVKPKIKDIPPEKPPEQRGPHNGYPLTRRMEDGDEPVNEDLVDDIRWKNFAWSFMPLFNLENELRSGIWKCPIYRPPCDVNFDISDFESVLYKIPMCYTYM